jgi:hypothetical protein
VPWWETEARVDEALGLLSAHAERLGARP